MILYHGTSAYAGWEAWEKGLLPRSMLCMPVSNYTDCPSATDSVYLTDAYAPYFAMNTKEKGDKIAILEVDLSNANILSFLPDEDFIEQVLRHQPDNPFHKDMKGMNMRERTAHIRDSIYGFRDYWQDSLRFLGTLRHRGPIMPELITRMSIISYKENSQMHLMAADPLITLMNYAICADKYRALTRWFMGDPVTVDELFTIAGTVTTYNDKSAEIMQKAIDDRDCIEVITRGKHE